MSSSNRKAIAYGLMNIVSASGIVFANKYVFANCKFHFTYALTWVHTVFTLLGMVLFAKMNMFETKRIPAGRLVPLAGAYVAYIVLCNLSLNVNTVGFYQVMKIAVAPTVIALELLMFRRLPGPKIIMSVCLVCAGIAVATVTDSQMIRNLFGIAVGLAATLMTALYQIWAGSKQKELKASSMQLLHAYTPQAALILGVLIPIFEPMGWSSRADGTLLGYTYSWHSVLAILISSALGLAVSLSTFLVIGATSSLTYNVVGHLKTLIILTGGCLFFGDEMPPKKLLGVSIAMAGIVWYTQLKLASAAQGQLGGTKGEKGETNPYRRILPMHANSVGAGLLPISDMLTARSAYTAQGLNSRKQGGGVELGGGYAGGGSVGGGAGAGVGQGGQQNGHAQPQTGGMNGHGGVHHRHN